ncbi:MAG: small multi-drug export protein [Clostridia bacterium]|nr:small multi-drug export protein [Clostridia bacterium]
MLHNTLIRFAPLMTATAFVWQENVTKILTTAFLSMVPTFEGRYAVPVAVAMGMPTMFAFLLAFICSSIPVPFILLLLRPILDWFYTLPIKPVRKFAAWLEARGEKKRVKMHENQDAGLRGKLKKYVSAETIELLGLYIFVALPLPGTGGWTGSLIATLFKMPRMKSFITIVLGNATACLITTLATTGVLAIF